MSIKNTINFLKDDEELFDSPRDFEDNVSTFCVKSNYFQGDKNAILKLTEEIRSHKNYKQSFEYDYDFSNLADLFELAKNIDLFAAYSYIYSYTHSGTTISTEPFQCRFDSCKSGFAYVTKDEARVNFQCKKITRKIVQQCEDIIKTEVKELDNYLNGGEEYYFVSLENSEGSIIDDLGHVAYSNLKDGSYLQDFNEEHHEALKVSVLETFNF